MRKAQLDGSTTLSLPGRAVNPQKKVKHYPREQLMPYISPPGAGTNTARSLEPSCPKNCCWTPGPSTASATSTASPTGGSQAQPPGEEGGGPQAPPGPQGLGLLRLGPASRCDWPSLLGPLGPAWALSAAPVEWASPQGTVKRQEALSLGRPFPAGKLR